MQRCFLLEHRSGALCQTHRNAARCRSASHAARRLRAIPPVVAFEPSVSSAALLPQLVVLATTFGLAGYWWLIFVPSERASLARSKRGGELKEYLQALESDRSRSLERWFYTDWLNKRAKLAAGTTLADNQPDLQKSEPKSDAAQPADISELNPSTKPQPNDQPAFWSLDNPVVLVGMLLALTVGQAVLFNSAGQLSTKFTPSTTAETNVAAFHSSLDSGPDQ